MTWNYRFFRDSHGYLNVVTFGGESKTEVLAALRMAVRDIRKSDHDPITDTMLPKSRKVRPTITPSRTIKKKGDGAKHQ